MPKPLQRLFQYLMILLLLGCVPPPPPQELATSSPYHPSETHITHRLEAPMLWPSMREHFAIQYNQNHPLIRTQIRWHVNHPDYMLTTTTRATPFLAYIAKEVAKRKLPAELALIPMVESGYDPFAYSHAGAVGIWQLMPQTAHRLGLKENWWYNGSRDIMNSTKAALDYLTYLNQTFDGDWLLTLAAYNAGEGSVKSAVRNNKRRNLPTDFFSLTLPRETKTFVPKILVLATMINNPDTYHQELAEIPLASFFKTIPIDGQMDLTFAAKLADMNVKSLYELNSGFNRFASAPDGPHRLLLPLTQVEKFQNEIKKIDPNKRIQWQRYKVKRNDSLIKIAKNFNVSPIALKQVNHLSNNLIKADAYLMIPKTLQPQALNKLSKRFRTPLIKKVNYSVKDGDSLYKIAHKHHVTIAELKGWNHTLTKKKYLKAGDKVDIFIKIAGHTKTFTKKNKASSSSTKKVATRKNKHQKNNTTAAKTYTNKKIAKKTPQIKQTKVALIIPGHPSSKNVELSIK